MKRLEREALVADREAVLGLLADAGDDDPIGKISLTSRLSEIEARIRELPENDVVGSIALLFSGKPVHGSRSISTEFTTALLSSFQDLVARHVAASEGGRLGSRGRVPDRMRSSLAIRELVRGSVGFVLEEKSENGQLVDTSVKKAIDDVYDVIVQAAAESDDDFERSVETLDPRTLVSLRQFFRTLDDHDASVRLVEDERDASLSKQAVHRARIRVDDTEVEDRESTAIVGELLGLLPESRRFEMKLRDTGEVIKGTVAAEFADKWLELIEEPDVRLVGAVWRVAMRVREVRERNRSPRNLFSLLGLIERDV